MPHVSKVVIVGGGITGLAAAWELQQQGVDYILLEGSNRLGGKILTERVDGFIIEGAADSFLTQKPAAWQLCHEIGLADRLIGTSDAQRNVYVLRNGKLHLFPRGMRLIVPLDPDGLMKSELLSDEGKRRMLAEPTIPPRTETGDESLASFVERRFGHEALTVFGDSLLAGIHVADPQHLSMAAAFPNYLELEQKYGSVIRGMQNSVPVSVDPNAPKTVFASLRGGMIELVEGLQSKLTGDIRVGQQVVRIEPDRTVHLSNGDSFKPEAVILTTPASHTAKLLQWHEQLSEILATFKTVSSGTVSLGFRANDIEHPRNGFGFIIPHSEPTRIIACTWSSTKLSYRAPEGYVLLRVFVGGYGREKDVNLSNEQLVALARHELQQIMGIRAEPVITRVFRWCSADPHLNASPQYEVGHIDRISRLRSSSPSWLYLTGCAYGGVGIPDCIQQGRIAARTVISH